MGTLLTIAFIILDFLVTLIYWKAFYTPLQDRQRKIEQLSIFFDGFNHENSELSSADEEFKHDKSLYSTWKKYKRNLIQHTHSNGTILYYSSVDTIEIFSVTELLSGLSFDFWKNLAGIYTGLGILGTFVGLTYGLSNIDMSTNAGLQAGISSLLSGTNTAFLTSIAGLIFAIGFNFIFHCYTIKRFTHTVNNLCESINNVFPYKKAEDILCWQLEESRTQTAVLKSLSADLGQVINETLEDVQDALERSIEHNFKPLFEELLTTIKALNSGGMTALTESFNEGAGKQIISFAQTLNELEQGMKMIMEESRTANEESMRQLRQSIEELTKQMNATIAASVDANTKGALQNQETLTKIVQDVKDTLNTAVLEMTAASTQSHTNFTNTMARSAENMEKMTAAWSTGIKAQSDGFAHVSKHVKATLEDMLERLRQELENHEKRTAQLLTTFNGTVASSSALVEKAGTTAEQFSQAAVPMQSAANEMNGQITKVIDATAQFNEHVENHSTLFHDSITKNVYAMEKIETSVGTMEKSWKEYEERFGIVNQGLENTFKILLENIRQYNDLTSNGLKENLKAFDDSIKTVLSGISGLNEELTSGIEDLNTSIEELKKSIQSFHPHNINQTYKK